MFSRNKQKTESKPKLKRSSSSSSSDDDTGLTHVTTAIEDAMSSITTKDTTAQPPLGMVMDVSDSTWTALLTSGEHQQRFPYARPEFLYFCDEELSLSADQTTRPVLVPKFINKMPLHAGYAECLNGGKTVLNEDQASAKVLHLVRLFMYLKDDYFIRNNPPPHQYPKRRTRKQTRKQQAGIHPVRRRVTVVRRHR
jgi:hypothetical protein